MELSDVGPRRAPAVRSVAVVIARGSHLPRGESFEVVMGLYSSSHSFLTLNPLYLLSTAFDFSYHEVLSRPAARGAIFSSCHS